MALMSVLEFMHEFAHESAASVGRDRRIEMQNSMLAICAAECLGDRAEKRLGAFRAKRRSDPRCPVSTALAKVFMPADVTQTDDADRRVEERTQRAQRIKVCDSPHI